MKQNIVKKINSAPINAGVYIFYANKKPVYIGKAANLKNRLKSYLKITDLKTEIIQKEANRLKLISLQSPIEALIKEAALIKAFKPELNFYWQDDKNYFYAAFTADKFPKIIITHQPQIQNSNFVRQSAGRTSNFEFRASNLTYVGPFTDGQALKSALKIIRRRHPYCTCRKPHLRHCLNAQIGLCPGYCCNLAKQKECLGSERALYQTNIKVIRSLLSGKRPALLRKIISPGNGWLAENILSHTPYLEKSSLRRIECYDISNMSGKEAVGAMTVLANSDGRLWLADKSQFRRFKIKLANTRNDPKMIGEILTRRLNHPEWPYPDLVIVDGGVAQYNAAKQALEARSLKPEIKLIGFAKPTKTVYGSANLLDKKIVEKAIQQTHNYVINYHRRLRDRIKI